MRDFVSFPFMVELKKGGRDQMRIVVFQSRQRRILEGGDDV